MTRSIVRKLESLIGGDTTAFSLEIEKARFEAISRCRTRAVAVGGNAALSVGVETSEIGARLIVFSATGTAVVVEPETS